MAFRGILDAIRLPKTPIQNQLDAVGLPKTSFREQLDAVRLPKTPFQGQLYPSKTLARLTKPMSNLPKLLQIQQDANS